MSNLGKFPLFAGENPLFWIEAMEDIFEDLQVPWESYVEMATRCLRGSARNWWLRDGSIFLEKDWCAFSYNLLWEFAPSSKLSDEEESTIDGNGNHPVEVPILCEGADEIEPTTHESESMAKDNQIEEEESTINGTNNQPIEVLVPCPCEDEIDSTTYESVDDDIVVAEDNKVLVPKILDISSWCATGCGQIGHTPQVCDEMLLRDVCQYLEGPNWCVGYFCGLFKPHNILLRTKVGIIIYNKVDPDSYSLRGGDEVFVISVESAIAREKFWIDIMVSLFPLNLITSIHCVTIASSITLTNAYSVSSQTLLSNVSTILDKFYGNMTGLSN